MPTLQVRRVALLNSPHNGSAAATDPARRLSGYETWQCLPQASQCGAVDAPTLATWCPFDLMVVPGSSARWKQASLLLRLDIPMHIWPVLSVRTHRSIADFLGSNNSAKLKK